MLREHLSHRQAGGEMASDGQPPAHAGHQHLLPAVPLAGAQIHEEQRALPAPQNPHRLQLQHGLPQLLHLQRGRLLVETVDVLLVTVHVRICGSLTRTITVPCGFRLTLLRCISFEPALPRSSSQRCSLVFV